MAPSVPSDVSTIATGQDTNFVLTPAPSHRSLGFAKFLHVQLYFIGALSDADQAPREYVLDRCCEYRYLKANFESLWDCQQFPPSPIHSHEELVKLSSPLASAFHKWRASIQQDCPADAELRECIDEIVAILVARKSIEREAGQMLQWGSVRLREAEIFRGKLD